MRALITLISTPSKRLTEWNVYIHQPALLEKHAIPNLGKKKKKNKTREKFFLLLYYDLWKNVNEVMEFRRYLHDAAFLFVYLVSNGIIYAFF